MPRHHSLPLLSQQNELCTLYQPSRHHIEDHAEPSVISLSELVHLVLFSFASHYTIELVKGFHFELDLCLNESGVCLNSLVEGLEELVVVLFANELREWDLRLVGGCFNGGVGDNSIVKIHWKELRTAYRLIDQETHDIFDLRVSA